MQSSLILGSLIRKGVRIHCEVGASSVSIFVFLAPFTQLNICNSSVAFPTRKKKLAPKPARTPIEHLNNVSGSHTLCLWAQYHILSVKNRHQSLQRGSSGCENAAVTCLPGYPGVWSFPWSCCFGLHCPAFPALGLNFQACKGFLRAEDRARESRDSGQGFCHHRQPRKTPTAEQFIILCQTWILSIEVNMDMSPTDYSETMVKGLNGFIPQTLVEHLSRAADIHWIFIMCQTLY